MAEATGVKGAKVHPLADLEIREAVEWLQERSVRAADRFLDEMATLRERIVAIPGLGHPCGRFRRVNLKRYPYHLLYAISDSDEVWVLVMRHDSRHPDYGMDRTIPGEP